MRIVLALVAVLAAPIDGRAETAALICCNQIGAGSTTAAQMNANLVCPLGSTSCSVTARTVESPATCPASLDGCALDFGDRPVSFDGTLTIGTGKLVVKARSITVNAAIAANGATSVELTTAGTDCTDGGGDLVVRSSIDASAAGVPGLIRLLSACGISLETGAQLLASSSTTFGGTIDLRAATTLTQAGAVKAIGGGSDGGIVSLAAGGDLQVQRVIDVRSLSDGDGGSILLRAGDRTLAAAALGGMLTVAADLILDGSTDSDGESGNGGGDVTLEAAGPLVVNATATIHASGAGPDGAGGLLSVLTEAPPTGVLTPLDGDASLLGPIVLRGAASGDGGEMAATVGRTLELAGGIDVSAGGDDAFGGSVEITTGADFRLDAAIAANGRVASGSGGSVDLKAGMATGTAMLTIAKNVDVSAGNGAEGGDARLAACRLAVQPSVVVDARGSGTTIADPTITLAGTSTLTIGGNAKFLAQAASGTLLAHAPSASTSIGAGVVFNPRVMTTVAAPAQSPLPPCPVCGDGIRQPGEPCDPGAGADGACCRNDCLAFICATPTPSPAVQATGATVTTTISPTSAPTASPTPTITATPPLPPLVPRAVLGCERALAKGMSRLVAAELGFLETCSLDVLGCRAASEGDDGSACMLRAARRCGSRFVKLARARTKFEATFAKACAGDPPVLPLEALRSTAVLSFATLDDTCAAEVGLDLTSASAIRTCLEHGACAAERALAIAVPQLGALVPSVFDTGGAGLCLPPGDASSVGTLVPSRSAVRCQRVIVGAGRKLLGKQLTVAQRCVDTLLTCRLRGQNADACSAVAARCAEKLASLTAPAGGVLARLTASIVGGCGGIPADALLLPSGLGFANAADACVAFGTPPPSGPDTLAPCIGAAYGCAAASITRRALPLVDAELARAGLALGDAFTCPIASPSPTPTATPGGTTPTRTSTPTPLPTVAPTTLLLPGGGIAGTDCVAEWTVVGGAGTTKSPTTFDCVDGDPACDIDGQNDDRCHLRVGLCFTATDPTLPQCPAAPALASFILQSPQPGAADPTDAANAQALVGAVATLTGTAPGGASQNAFTFAPPLAFLPSSNCTAPVTITVERRGLTRRTERFRTRAIAAPASSGPAPTTGIRCTSAASGNEIPAGALAGRVTGSALDFAAMRVEDRVRAEAAALGFTSCGFAAATPIARGAFLDGWLAAGFAGGMHYLGRHPERRLTVAGILPRARTVISLAYPYAPPPPPSLDWRRTLRGRIAAYARGSDYHRVIDERLAALAAVLTDLWPGHATRRYVDTGAVLEREWGMRGGLGWFGKNTMLLATRAGSWFFLAELVTEAALAPDAPTSDHCGRCTRCLDACPTAALADGLVMDARRCIAYLTIEHRGPIPRALRPRLGPWIFGCDVCQEVCPWNPVAPPARGADAGGLAPFLPDLLGLDPSGFRHRFADTSLARTRRRGLLRNAAVALGNTGNPAAVPALRFALGDRDPLVRQHAAWALGAIGNADAADALAARADRETHPAVTEEIATARATIESTPPPAW